MIGYVSVDEQVEKDFDRALLKAFLHRLRNHLRRRDGVHGRLPSFDEAKGALAQWTQAYQGMRIVDVEKVKGSVGRYKDFDGSFLPLKVDMADRWGRIDRAYHKGDELPAVSLYKIGEAYFVRDGNHRVSVAKYHKVATIDAEVVEIKGRMRSDAAHGDGPVGAHERPISQEQVNRHSGDLPRPSQEEKAAKPITIKEGTQQTTITTNSKEAWWGPGGRSRVTTALGLLVGALLVVALMLLGASTPAHASTTLAVTNTSVHGSGACDAACTLREAITAADYTPNSGGPDLIRFYIPQEQDVGPTGLQNTIASAVTASGKTTIMGKVSSEPNQTYVVRFFSNPSGNEGKKFIGQKWVTTGSDCKVSFAFMPAR